MPSPFTGRYSGTFTAHEHADGLRALVDAGALAPVVDRVRPLGETAVAVRRLLDDRVTGKPALTVPAGTVGEEPAQTWIRLVLGACVFVDGAESGSVPKRRWCGGRRVRGRWAHSYRRRSDSRSICWICSTVRPGRSSWARVTSALVGWASAGTHCSGCQAWARISDLGQCG